jgi:hypothetical protein
VLHRPILVASLLVLLSFGFLTGYVIATTGFGPLEAISILVLGLFASAWSARCASRPSSLGGATCGRSRLLRHSSSPCCSQAAAAVAPWPARPAAVGAPAAVVQAEADGARVLQAANGPLTATAPPVPLAVKLEAVDDPVVFAPKRKPRAGLLFDLDTGEVLWRKDPLRRLPIASVTKMMTAIIVAQRVPEGDRVKVTNEARARPGSRIGVLPKKSASASARCSTA